MLRLRILGCVTKVIHVLSGALDRFSGELEE